MGKQIFALFIGLISFLTLSTEVLAGGGPVTLTVFPLKPFYQTQTYIGQADIYSLNSCNDLTAKFSLKDSVNDDEVSPFNPPDDSTYSERHYFSGQPDFIWKKVCTFYSKVKSGEKRQRTLIVEVSINGNLEKREIPVSFGDDPISTQLQDFDRYNNAPQVDVVNETYLGGPKRAVELQWNKVEKAARYAIFLRQAGMEGPPTQALTTTTDTKITINFAAFLPFYIGVNSCSENETCQTVKPNTWEVFIDKMHTSNISQPMSTPPSQSIITPSVGPINGPVLGEPVMRDAPDQQAKVDALNKKVAELESKLNQSQTKQNVLEQRLNAFINLLRRIFPFLN